MSKFVVVLGAIVIDASNNKLSITEVATPNLATIASGTYYLRGDGTASDFCLALKTALEAAGASANTYSVTPTTDGTTVSWDTAPANVSGKVRIARLAGADNFKIGWVTAGTTFVPAMLGFAVEKGAADANVEVSTLSPTTAWVANEYHRDIVPGTRWDIQATDIASGDTNVVRRGDKMQTRTIAFQWIDGRRLWLSLNTTDSRATLESFIDSNNDGRPVELHEQTLLSSSVTTLGALTSSTRVGVAWRLAEGSGDRVDASRAQLGLDLWDFDIVLVGAV